MNKTFTAFLVAILIANTFLLPSEAHNSSTAGSTWHNPGKVSQRENVALALGDGGVRGAAHIGVLRVFQQEGIPIDYIVGNSMGAVVGGLHCAGVSLDDVQSILEKNTPK
jgi:predicted acylesterase/phospholipase RssA